jgi:hypothetical protein
LFRRVDLADAWGIRRSGSDHQSLFDRMIHTL